MLKTDPDLPKRVFGGLIAGAIIVVAGWAAHLEFPWLAAGLGLLLGFSATVTWHWHWHAPFGSRIKGSRFEFEVLTKKAKKSIFLVGPCLNYIATQTSARELIYRKLAEPGFQVWMLLSKPREPVALVWEDVAYGSGFGQELDRAIATFRGWLNSTERPRLEIKVTGLVTLGLIFVDADDASNARVLVIPIPWNVAGEARPCFLLRRRQHPVAFDVYYDAYRSLFQSGQLAQELSAQS
jgi:hypothetical protein